MKTLLNRPFPFLHRQKHLVFWLIELLVLVTLFEYFLEPFTRNYSEHRYSYFIICLVHAGVVASSYLLVILALHMIKRPAVWRIRHELLLVFFILTLLGIGNFLIRDVIYANDNWRWGLFNEELIHGYIAGGLFYGMITQINIRIHHYWNAPPKSPIASSTSDKTRIEAAVAMDSFLVDLQKIVCIKSDGNYASFYLKISEQMETKMIRQTMDKLEEQLSQHPQFIRTHRAYIVNNTYVHSFSGNTGGYQLTVDQLDFKVPVSRANVKKFDEVRSPV